MNSVHEILSRDHEELDGLLTRAVREDGTVSLDLWNEFRRRLLRHIGIEERVLFPLLRSSSNPVGLERQLHRDHAAISALLVPPPTIAEVEQIRSLLAAHNPLEEDAGGLYEQLDELVTGTTREEVLARIESFPQIPVAPFSDTELLRRTIAGLVREAEEGRRQFRP